MEYVPSEIGIACCHSYWEPTKLKADNVLQKKGKYDRGNGNQQNNENVDDLILPFILLESGKNTEAETYRYTEKS